LFLLAHRLKAKAEQVRLFTRNVPLPGATTPASRRSRGRNYLVTSRNHGLRPIDAIHAAPTNRSNPHYDETLGPSEGSTRSREASPSR